VSDNRQITALSQRDITLRIARSLSLLQRHIRAYRRSDNMIEQSKQIEMVERELDSVFYWFGILISDGSHSGVVLNRLIHTMHAVLDMAVLAVRSFRYQKFPHG
jgi:hypothetical protein